MKGRLGDIDCSGDEPLTKQEFAQDCDVNIIIARCLRSGLPLPSVTAEPLFADVSQVGSYADCLRRVTAAREAFNGLPATLRREFGNDPARLIAFLGDSKNRDRAIELGLIEAPKEPSVPGSPGVPPALPAVPPVAAVPPAK